MFRLPHGRRPDPVLLRGVAPTSDTARLRPNLQPTTKPLHPTLLRSQILQPRNRSQKMLPYAFLMNMKLVSLAAVVLLATPAFPQVPASQRMVVMISLDGFPAFALDDPKLPAPTLRRLIREGVTARMHTVNPTVTWPNHTTLVTGVRADEHGLLVNGSIVPTNSWPPVKVEPMVEKEKMVHVPTVYDAANHAGLTTAQVDWVAIHKAPTITWPFAEWAAPEDPVVVEMLRKGVIVPGDVQDFT